MSPPYTTRLTLGYERLYQCERPLPKFEGDREVTSVNTMLADTNPPLRVASGKGYHANVQCVWLHVERVIWLEG